MSWKIDIPKFLIFIYNPLFMQAHSETFQTEELSEGNSTLREFIGFMRDLVIIFLIVIVIR